MFFRGTVNEEKCQEITFYNISQRKLQVNLFSLKKKTLKFDLK